MMELWSSYYRPQDNSFQCQEWNVFTLADDVTKEALVTIVIENFRMVNRFS